MSEHTQGVTGVTGSRSALALLAIVVLVGGATCNVISGAGSIDFSGTGGHGSTGSGSTASGCAPADCSNPACRATLHCVDAVPAGWEGPFALYEGPEAQSPGCGGSFPVSRYTGHGDLSADPASCSCSCNPAVGQTCAESTTPIFLGDAPCGASVACFGNFTEAATWNGSCDSSNNFAGGNTTCCGGTAPCHQQVTAAALQLGGTGSCSASGKAPTLPPVTFGTYGEACAATSAPGCAGASQTCQPVPAAPFHAGLCIMKAGQVSCPAGAFSELHVLHGDPVDGRTCTGCTCGPASGGSCAAKVEVYAGATCSGAPLATLHPTSAGPDCADLGGNPAVQALTVTFTLTPATCSPGGGQPSGSVTPGPATTFCCIPPG